MEEIGITVETPKQPERYLRSTANTKPNLMDILIFKTNLSNAERVRSVQPLMRNIEGIHRWNIDMHDCDNVLRIEASELSPRTVENALQNAGYYCEELQD